MKRDNAKKSFVEMQTLAGNNESLRQSIFARTTAKTAEKIPFTGLKQLFKFFLVYFLVSLAVYWLAGYLMPAKTLPVEYSYESELDQIAQGLEWFFSSERLINSFVEGCFKLFFKISFLAFFLAAASLNAESSDSGKGENLCEN
ncbi:MAG: hypothetical protein ACOYXC_21185 [Candidatus Rifleibacteriota bacterium]